MATDGISYELNGLPELLGKLEGLEFDMKRKGGRFALRKAAQVLRDQGRENAERVDDPQTPESIAENIVERWSGRTFKRTGNMKFRVGVLGGARQYANTRENVRKGRAGQSYRTDGDKSNPGGDTWYWRLLEFGTENMGAQPIFRPVPAQAGQAAADEFVRQYSKKIDRVLRQAKKKATK
ncbi:hypothetical protein BKP64_10970 [Marinobacter salinus]|uniref:HK97 gp10 family phage protein n=1 Tax=Marinobacter salinus TaxID=1874317 RepID=A0A1D9GML5_9GAMM|nr:HK97-gp10 family putative phage morphogenesis protein [Marinobacter salinus]AOY88650.1 hypothetical protein BKP64_10970 [Marinobacter salinus]